MKSLKMGARSFDILPVLAGSVIKRFLGNSHCHNHIEIWYVLKGEMRHTIGDREYLQTPGSFSLVRAYTPHLTDTTISEDTPVIFSAHADEKALEALSYDCFLRHSAFAAFDGRELPEFIELSGDQKNAADILARALLDEDSKKYLGSLERRCHLFAEFIGTINRDMPSLYIKRGMKEKTRLINYVVDYIIKHASEKLSLDHLSELSLMSKRRFTDNFRSVTGLTAWELQKLQRMFLADQLLCFTEKTLEEIAEEIGYYDKSDFSHVFTSHFGVTPSEYRRNNTDISYKWESGERLKRLHRYETLNYYYSLSHNGEHLPKSSVSHMPNLL
ncbi:MAG: helix-turn-helix transcriptional regulator [Oscillospiraceae bacterium]|nr:helix-turn-helix transcriptional regulator [Oscillospiraceae bacterium]